MAPISDVYLGSVSQITNELESSGDRGELWVQTE